MTQRLEEKVAVVTGAGQGIGQAIALALSANGATVVVVDLNTEASEETMAGLSGEGMALACNVADSASVKVVFEQVEKKYGRLDILVNNAGIGGAKGDGFGRYMKRKAERSEQIARGEEPTVFADHIIDMSDEGWQAVLNVNLNGAFYCCREAVKVMIRHGIQGSIINLSSTSAFNGESGAHYCASKAGILGLTKSLAEELALRGIRVNAIVPGPTMTKALMGASPEWREEMAQGVPMKRLAQPEEIAGTAIFLASEESSYYTGQSLCANGGWYMQ